MSPAKTPDFLTAVIDYIETAGIATFGTTMYAGQYPSTAPDECILVRMSGGPEASKEVPLARPMIQVLSRALYYPAAAERIQKVYELFHGYVDTAGKWVSHHNYQLGDFYVHESRAIQRPGDISPDEKDRAELSVNFMFKIIVPARKV